MIIQEKIDALLKERFMNSSEFTNTIELAVKNSNFTISYIDAILDYCESHDIEIESVTKLISKPLKDKLEADAMRLNFIERTSKGTLNL